MPLDRDGNRNDDFKGTGEVKATELLGRLDLGDESRAKGLRRSTGFCLVQLSENTDELAGLNSVET